MKTLLTLLILLHASVQDTKTGHIDDWCFIFIMVLYESPDIKGFIITALIYLALIVMISLFKLPAPLGLGDAKILSAISFSFGFIFCSKVFIISSLFAGAFALAIVIYQNNKKRKTSASFPYLPFITLGFIAQSLFSLL